MRTCKSSTTAADAAGQDIARGPPEQHPDLDWFFVSILGLSGLIFFLGRGVTPWGWPSLDMATYYVRLEQPTWLQSDFYTTCTAGFGGRSFFGALTSLPMRFGLDWYRNMYLWMAVNQVVKAPALYLGLAAVLPRRSLPAALALFLFSFASVAAPDLLDRVCVAWWRGWGDFFHPSLFSISLACLGAYSVFASQGRPWRVGAGAVVIVLGLFVHPAYGLGSTLLILLCAIHTRPWRLCAFYGGVVVAAVVAFGLLYGGPALSATEYQQYFAWLHPEHYIPSRFVGMRGQPWWLGFAIVSAVLLLVTTLFWRGRRQVEARIALGLFLFYAGSLAAQYLFVEFWPVSRSVIVLSPSRFLAFGYWSCAIVLAMAVARVPLPPLHRIAKVLPRRSLTTGGVAAAIALILFGFTRLGQPADRLSPGGRALLDWVRTDTDSNAVFAGVADMTAIALPMLTGRGLYVGNGFPFVDRCIEANYDRYVQLFGTPTGPHGRATASEHFDALQMRDFRNLRPHPDYVIARRQTSHLADTAPVYQNEEFSVFHVR